MINTHEKQVTKLEKEYSTSVKKNHILTSIGNNAMNSLRGQASPDPKSFTTDTDHDRLTTLICKFLTKTNIEDSEQWTTTITYPHQSGSMYQVMCQKHAAYMNNMASPCCHAVKMHQFSTKCDFDRTTGHASLKDLNRFAPGTHFKGEFLQKIYHPALTISQEKLALLATLHVYTHSSYSPPNAQQKVNKYARN